MKSRLVTIAEFPNLFDVKFSLLKDMLEDAGIPFITNNENARTTKPLIANISNLAIDIRVYEEDLSAAMEILQSIK